MLIYCKRESIAALGRVAGIVFVGLFLFPIHIQAQAPKYLCENDNSVSISGKVALFYAPSQSEFDLHDTGDQEAYTELLSDFYEYAERLSRYFDMHEIEWVLTGSRYFKIELNEKIICYDRVALSEEVGLLLINGIKEPVIIPGIFMDSEVAPIIREYYSLDE